MALPHGGFLIVTRFEVLYRDYCNRIEKIAREQWGFTNELIYSIPQQSVSPTEVRKKYRGIDRVPLIAWPSRQFPEETWMGREEPEACQTLEDLETSAGAQEGFIFSIRDARRVSSLLRYPERWETIWARNSGVEIDRTGVGSTLGFEPTWFVGDRFSAVCDCMCFPKWHGTDKEGLLFADYYERLNECALFNSAEEAKAFLDFYRSFDWTETGDYVIAEICLPAEVA
jgi:hypothetical protein